MKIIKHALRYIKYLFKSQNHYSIHSPTIYNFISNVIYSTTSKSETKEIEELRVQLYANESFINIKDYGAGSNINNNNKRKIKEIARNSSKNSKYGNLLYRIVKSLNPNTIFELGTSFGISTCYLAKGSPQATITTFEGCNESVKIASNNFAKLEFNNIKIIHGNFKDTLEKEFAQNNNLDLIFIDGNHTENATIKYFELALNHSHNKTIIIFDDIHWSKGMENAWKHITRSKKTTVTIDLFFVGIVFLDPKLSKENFIIRF